MNLLRVLLCSVLRVHPSDVPPKSKISVQIEKSGNGRRSGAFYTSASKIVVLARLFGVRQRPPQGAEFVCIPCGANNSKSGGSDTVSVRPRLPAPKGKVALAAFLFSTIFSIGKCRRGSNRRRTDRNAAQSGHAARGWYMPVCRSCRRSCTAPGCRKKQTSPHTCIG